MKFISLSVFFASLTLLNPKPVLASPVPTPTPDIWGLNLSKEILTNSEPYLFNAANALVSYRKSEDLSKEPSRLLEHQKNTQSHVDQNGVPWARPPPPGSVDMEVFLDERHYKRYEQMYKDGHIMIEQGPDGENRLVYTNIFENDGNRKPVDVEYGTDMFSLLGKQNVRAKDKSGKTLYDKYLSGEIDVTQQSLFGKSIPKEYSDDVAVRVRYNIPLVEKQIPVEEQLNCEEPETPEWSDEDVQRLAVCLGLSDQVKAPRGMRKFQSG